jgi:ribosome-associated heat shock protein Hsp15
MISEESVRIDKWLWAVRIFKTRSSAADACRKGKVSVNGVDVRPSRIVRVGEVVALRQSPIVRTFMVKGLLEKRVGAKIAGDFVTELTPEAEFEKLRLARSDSFGFRDKGSGRPTKRERRSIEKLKKSGG